MSIKSLKITFLIALCLLTSCATKQVSEPIVVAKFINVKSEGTDARLEETEEIISEVIPDFNNTTTNQKTAILMHEERSGFSVFNDVKFKSDSVGV